MGQYSVVADIEQVFYQLKIKESDQVALRFSWRATKFENPIDCVMTEHLFGKNNSPCVTNYKLEKCAKDQSNNFDAKIVKWVEEFCMDDFHKSKNSEKYSLKLSNDLIEIFSNCKFCLTKSLSNSKIIMSFLLKVSYPQNLIVLMKALSKEF